MMTNSAGAAVSLHDYLPFGEEIPGAVGGRTPAPLYTASDELTKKFTGKERDGETAGTDLGVGLDYFGARYFSEAQGRFTGADPFIPFNLKKEQFRAWISNPQHWNKYAYALNNPFLYIDPSGMTETVYYWLNSSMTDAQKKFFQEHKKEILSGVADKLKKEAGINDVVFKEGSALSRSQISSIMDTQPKGVAFLNFADKSYGGVSAGPTLFGAENGMRTVVFMGNLQAGNPDASELSFRLSEVSSHEIGHAMGFYSRGETMSFIKFWNHDLMNEGQGLPSSASPGHFDMSIPENRQAVDEINKLPEYTPPQ